MRSASSVRMSRDSQGTSTLGLRSAAGAASSRNSERQDLGYVRRIVGMGVVRNRALLQLKDVVGLLEGGTRWKVRGRVEASGRSVG